MNTLDKRIGVSIVAHRPDFPIDLTDRVLRADIQTGDVSSVGTRATGVDGAATVLTLTLDGEDTVDAPDLSPASIFSPINEPDVLLRPYRRVTVTAGIEGEERVTLFEGFLGADVTVTSDVNRRSISVAAQDLTKPLRDLFILAPENLVVNGTSLPEVIQTALGLVPLAVRPKLRVIGTPNYTITNYTVNEITAWEAIQRVVNGTTWWIGAIGDELVLLEPPRDTQRADIERDWDDGFEDNASITDAHLRNRVTVIYPGGSVTRENAGSIASFSGGIPRASKIGNTDSSEPGPKNQNEAEEYAEAFLHDLSEPYATSRFVIPFEPGLRPFTRVGLNNPKYGGLPRVISVSSIQHTIEPTKMRTVLLGSGRTTGSRKAWEALE